MRRADPAFLAVFMGWAALSTGAAALARGELMTRGFEGDTLHLLDIVTRMANGEWPHLDFMTPVGVLSFLPIVFFQSLGLSTGLAALAAQVLVSLIVLPAAFWAAYSRLERGWAYLFGGAMMVFVTAVVHSAGELGTSISMHYNRWAWAMALTAVLLAILPAQGRARPVLDGVIIGLALSLLALIKATYVVALAPAVVIVLLLRRATLTLGVGLAVGAVSAALVLAVGGLGFAFAYVGDLREVAASGIRPNPGTPFFAVLTRPDYIGGTVAILWAVILLRRSSMPGLGAMLLVLFPAFAFITYQNFSNDPIWLVLLTAVLFSVAGQLDEPDHGRKLRYAAILALAGVLPALYNYSVSSLRHLATSRAESIELALPAVDDSGIAMWNLRSDSAVLQVVEGGPGSLYAAHREAIEGQEPVIFRGEVVRECTILSGMNAWHELTAAGLRAQGVGPQDGVLVADVIQSLWLYGPFKPLEGGAPWYYADLPGLADASYVVIPACPLHLRVWKAVMQELEERELPLEEIERTEIYTLFRVLR
jgi:hypothetical protein